MTGQDLIFAILRNDAEAVRRMLDAGADPNEVTTSPWDRMTPLTAAANGKAGREILIPLLRAGAQLLTHSIPPGAWLDQEDEELQDLLQRAGILPFAAYVDDAIPFFEAVTHGETEDVARYLNAGIDPNLRTRSGTPVLHLAQSPDVIRLLVHAGADMEARGQIYRTALENACGGAFEAARALIELGANVNATHDHGYSTLMVAAGSFERDPEIVRLLLDNGADPRHVSELGYNALHEAVVVLDGEATVDAIVGMLVAAGTPLETRTNEGLTPLLLAICYGSPEEALCLIRHGADPNARVLRPEGSGYRHSATALMLAHPSAEVVAALLAAGAAPFATDDEERTALDYARAWLAEREEPDEATRALAARWRAMTVDEQDHDWQSFQEIGEKAGDAWELVSTYDGTVRSIALLETTTRSA